MTGPLGAPLRITARPSGEGAHVLEVSGDLVITNRDALREAIQRRLDPGEPAIVVDAARLSYIDTPSLALLVELASRCREAGGALVLAALPPAFAPLVKALRLEEAMELAGTVDEALDRLGA